MRTPFPRPRIPGFRPPRGPRKRRTAAETHRHVWLIAKLFHSFFAHVLFLNSKTNFLRYNSTFILLKSLSYLFVKILGHVNIVTLYIWLLVEQFFSASNTVSQVRLRSVRYIYYDM